MRLRLAALGLLLMVALGACTRVVPASHNERQHVSRHDSRTVEDERTRRAQWTLLAVGLIGLTASATALRAAAQHERRSRRARRSAATTAAGVVLLTFAGMLALAEIAFFVLVLTPDRNSVVNLPAVIIVLLFLPELLVMTALTAICLALGRGVLRRRRSSRDRAVVTFSTLAALVVGTGIAGAITHGSPHLWAALLTTALPLAVPALLFAPSSRADFVAPGKPAGALGKAQPSERIADRRTSAC